MSVPTHNLFPPELIADEYIRHNRDNRVLYVFYDTKHENYKDHYKKIFENETCKCANMFKITTKEEVEKQINANRAETPREFRRSTVFGVLWGGVSGAVMSERTDTAERPGAAYYQYTERTITCQVIGEQNHKEKDCFMLLFLGSLKDSDKPDIYNTEDKDSPITGIDIWRPFANNLKFIYRPKIFIFHAFYEDKSNTELDAKPYLPPYVDRKLTFSIPREADVLIVYKQTSNYVSDCRLIPYFRNLKKNLKDFGQRDDLINILTYTKCGAAKDFRPMIVSTLRKKIFMTTSEYRSHWYNIHKHLDDYSKILKQINERLESKKNERENVSQPTTSLENKPKKRKH